MWQTKVIWSWKNQVGNQINSCSGSSHTDTRNFLNPNHQKIRLPFKMFLVIHMAKNGNLKKGGCFTYCFWQKCKLCSNIRWQQRYKLKRRITNFFHGHYKEYSLLWNSKSIHIRIIRKHYTYLGMVDSLLFLTVLAPYNNRRYLKLCSRTITPLA